METKTAGDILGYKDLDAIDDFIRDDELDDHREEILARMQIAVSAINEAAVKILCEMYGEASAPYADRHIPRSFALRTAEYHDYLSEALLDLKQNGFFVEVG